jgi:bifunctional DNA-binding transcriptional regulator/antitoxin component of YhaV-PrlF toxin-antitoxin module
MAGIAIMEDDTHLGGMSEAPAASFKKVSAEASQSQRWSLKIGKDGRMVIPAAARALMELGEEGLVSAYIKDGTLNIISPNAALTRIQEIMKPYRSETHSIVDEFIAEKRFEAAREETEY